MMRRYFYSPSYVALKGFLEILSSSGKYKQKTPTGPFTILEPQDQKIGHFYVVQERSQLYSLSAHFFQH